jgi:arylsulfatase A-like enzyme
MSKQPNILMIVTDQEYAHQSLPAGFVLANRDRIHSRGVTFVNHRDRGGTSMTDQ